MTFTETKSNEQLLTVLGVVGGLMGSALLGVLLNPPMVLQQPSQDGVLGICSSDDEAVLRVCESLQATFTTGTALSFALVMLSVILCLGVAVQLDAWIAPALVFFQLSLWAMAVALAAASWMLLPVSHAAVVSAFMAVLVAGSFWALRPALCLGYYTCFKRGNISDILHWTLQSTWGYQGKLHLVSQSEMISILLSCGVDVNAVQHHTPLPLTPVEEHRRKLEQRLAQLFSTSPSSRAISAPVDVSTHGSPGNATAPLRPAKARAWWHFFKRSTTAEKEQDEEQMTPAITPLMRAVANPSVTPNVIHMLVDRGADVNAKDNEGNTPLHLAASWSRPDVIRVLLEHGADPRVANFTGAMPIIAALHASQLTGLSQGPSSAVIEEVYKVLSQALDATGTKHSKAWELAQDSILFQAAKAGDLDLVKHEVLVVKEDINKVGYHFEGLDITPLMIAANHGHVDVVEFLLSQEGIKLDCQATDGLTALMMAAAAGHAAIVVKLLQHGADVNMKCLPPADVSSNTTGGKAVSWNPGVGALWVAAKYGHADCVRALLDARYHVELDVGDGDGDTPLMMAAKGGHAEVVKLLLEAGANMYKHDRSYLRKLAFTAASYAAAGGHADVLRILLDADAQRSRFYFQRERFERLRALAEDQPTVLQLLDEYHVPGAPQHNTNDSTNHDKSAAGGSRAAAGDNSSKAGAAAAASASVNDVDSAHSGDENV